MKAKPIRVIAALIILCLIWAFFAYDLKTYLTLDYLKSQQNDFNDYYGNHPIKTVIIYMGLYIAVTALSLPGAAVMTLAGGALFGLFSGTLIVSFASSIGATLAFLASRFLLREWVQKKFGGN